MKAYWVKNNYGVNYNEEEDFSNHIQRSSRVMNSISSNDKQTRLSNSFVFVNAPSQQSQQFSKKNYQYTYQPKAILLGDISVGKTSILTQLTESKFEPIYQCSIGVEFRLKSIPIDQRTLVDLQIWDTCGQERFKTITRSYYQGKDASILVFDLTNESSFLNIEKWMGDIEVFGPKEMIHIIIGNKVDLESERVIEYERAEALARKHNCDYFEVSAKTGKGLGFCFEVFANTLAEVLKEENESKEETIKLMKTVSKDIASKGSNKSKCC